LLQPVMMVLSVGTLRLVRKRFRMAVVVVAPDTTRPTKRAAAVVVVRWELDLLARTILMVWLAVGQPCNRPTVGMALITTRLPIAAAVMAAELRTLPEMQKTVAVAVGSLGLARLDQ